MQPTLRTLSMRNGIHRTAPWFTTSVTLVLGVVMTLAAVQSLVVSNWAQGLGVLLAVALGGLVSGAVCARVPGLSPWVAHSLSVVLGIAWVINRMAPLLGPALPTWKDQATEFVIRLIILARTLQNGGTGEDLYLFVAVLAVLAWLLGYLTLWLLLQRRWVWMPIILNALVLLVNLTYASPKPSPVLFYIFFGAALLLLVLQSYLAHAQSWATALLDVPELLGWRFVASGAAVVLALLTATTLLPTHITNEQGTAVWQRVREPWLTIQHTWDRAFATINAPAGAGGSFSEGTLKLGGARSLGTELVMEVQARGPNTTPIPDYWRAVAYDRYTSERSSGAGGWTDTTGQLAATALGVPQEDQARALVSANELMPQIDTSERQLITQTFTLRQDFGPSTLFAATQPISVSLPTKVKTTFIPENGQIVANYSDTALIAVQNGAVRAGLTYTTTSLTSAAAKQSLRNASTSYPDWVQRYLQLPADAPLDRVTAKAREVVATAANPYDMAELIQNYLRSIPYDEQIPFPPAAQDPIDWFLFDLQRGYCDYYASAMVLMLRSEGVPTRLVSGYATGQFNSDTGVFEVRQNVAHTWVEVYFPGYGWQRFEPTPASYTSVPERSETPLLDGRAVGDSGGARAQGQGDPALDRDEQEQRLADLDQSAADSAQRRAQLTAQRAWEQWTKRVLAGLIAAGTLSMLIGAWFIRRRPRRTSYATLAYARALRLAQMAGIRVTDAATPREVAAQLARHVPAQRQPLTVIAVAYTRERYSQHVRLEPNAVERAWHQVRWPLLRMVLTLRVRAKRHRHVRGSDMMQRT